MWELFIGQEAGGTRAVCQLLRGTTSRAAVRGTCSRVWEENLLASSESDWPMSEKRIRPFYACVYPVGAYVVPSNVLFLSIGS